MSLTIREFFEIFEVIIGLDLLYMLPRLFRYTYTYQKIFSNEQLIFPSIMGTEKFWTRLPSQSENAVGVIEF